MEYNIAPAILHIDDNTHESVTIHDSMPGKNGYVYIIRASGEGDAVETHMLTWNTNDPASCLTCEEE